MRSSSPVADTRMPVRTGRVSSREADRATLSTVSTKASPGTLHASLGLRLREGREVLEAQRPDVERRRAGDDLDVLLGRAQLERDRCRPAARGRRPPAGGPAAPRRRRAPPRRRAAPAGRSPCRSPAARSRRRAPRSALRTAPGRRCAWRPPGSPSGVVRRARRVAWRASCGRQSVRSLKTSMDLDRLRLGCGSVHKAAERRRERVLAHNRACVRPWESVRSDGRHRSRLSSAVRRCTASKASGSSAMRSAVRR